jgi:hypothetical protein
MNPRPISTKRVLPGINELLKEHRDNRLVVIGSNQPREYIHADAVLDLNQFKQRIRQ